MRVGLIGCVKSKLDVPAPARDLYISPLFRGARCSVERSCDGWFVLSAEHGLVHPDQVLTPYEKSLASVGIPERRAWAVRVLGQIDAELGHVSERVFELHAGAAYLAFGLTDGLVRRGAEIQEPLAGLRQGERLRYYKDAGCL